MCYLLLVSPMYTTTIKTVSDMGILHVLKSLCFKGLMNSLTSQGLENSFFFKKKKIYLFILITWNLTKAW
jgi:hypothetical protein